MIYLRRGEFFPTLVRVGHFPRFHRRDDLLDAFRRFAPGDQDPPQESYFGVDFRCIGESRIAGVWLARRL